MSNLSEFQKEVGEWGFKTFYRKGQDNLKDFINSRICHLRREVDELRACVDFGARKQDELVDCFLILLHISHIYNIDLLEEAQKKMEINRYGISEGRVL